MLIIDDGEMNKDKNLNLKAQEKKSDRYPVLYLQVSWEKHQIQMDVH